MKILCIGDVMIPSDIFLGAVKGLEIDNKEVEDYNWETNWDKLQDRRLVIEQGGPSAEPVLSEIKQADKETEMLLGLFCPISKDSIDELPNLKLIGLSRAGLENINVDYATEKGIIVHNVMGRNAHAVSDFTVGLMFAETRNIARSHMAVKNGWWRKDFPNGDYIPEFHDSVIGLVGFGYIGQLVAKKLSGLDVKIKVYDPYQSEEEIAKHGAEKVSKEELFKTSDIVSVHARLTEDNKGMIGEEELEMMKKTAYFINTGRAGLIKEDALYEVLKSEKITGAALDVFWEEPLSEDSKWLELDNVTVTPHIAGTTENALTNSPYLLVEDINRLINDDDPKFIVNPEVLEKEKVKEWVKSIQK